jgi:hypothetical protein
MTQIEKDAQRSQRTAASTDNIRWEFVIVGSSLDDLARGKVSANGSPTNHFGPEGRTCRFVW